MLSNIAEKEQETGTGAFWTRFWHQLWDNPKAQQLDHSEFRIWCFFIREWQYWHIAKNRPAISFTYAKWQQTFPNVSLGRDTFYAARKSIIELGLIVKVDRAKFRNCDMFRLNEELFMETIPAIRPVGNYDRSENKDDAVPETRPVSYLKSAPKEYKNYEDNNTPPTPKWGECVNLFEKFWEAYPSKKTEFTRKRAWSAWQRVVPDEKTAKQIMTDLQRSKLSVKWTQKNGRYIPKPANYLQSGVWQSVVLPERSAALPPTSEFPMTHFQEAWESLARRVGLPGFQITPELIKEANQRWKDPQWRRDWKEALTRLPRFLVGVQDKAVFTPVWFLHESTVIKILKANILNPDMPSGHQSESRIAQNEYCAT